MTMKKLLLAGGAAALMLGTTAYASVLDRPFFKVQGVVVVWGADGVNGNGSIAHDFVLLTPANSGGAGDDIIGGAAEDGSTVVTGTLDAIIDTDVNTGALDSAGNPYPATNPVTGGATNGTFADAGADSGVLDATDTLSTFTVDANSDVTGGMVNVHRSSFYAASNAAFNISATAKNLTKTGDFNTDAAITLGSINYGMSLTQTGTDGGLTFGTKANTAAAIGSSSTTATSSMADYSAGSVVFTGLAKTAASAGSLAHQSVRFDNVYKLDDGTGNGYDLSMGTGTVQADMVFTVFVP